MSWIAWVSVLHVNVSDLTKLTAAILDLQHSLIMMTQDNKLFVCPAGKDKPLKRVLDAGCGTGIWTMDIGMSPQ